jgi:hypothetical protein
VEREATQMEAAEALAGADEIVRRLDDLRIESSPQGLIIWCQDAV